MKFTLEIDCDNDAFDGSPQLELSRILQCAARRLASQGINTTNTALFDANGNKVGQWTYGETK